MDAACGNQGDHPCLSPSSDNMHICRAYKINSLIECGAMPKQIGQSGQILGHVLHVNIFLRSHGIRPTSWWHLPQRQVPSGEVLHVPTGSDKLGLQSRLEHSRLQCPMCKLSYKHRCLQVAFLYRLAAGACPKSYGTSVAQLAGLPATLVKQAARLAQQLESHQASGTLAFHQAFAFTCWTYEAMIVSIYVS